MRNLLARLKDERGSNDASGGIGLFGAMFIVFLVLKLTGVIGWSWWWITSPLWLPWAILIGIWAVIMIVIGIVKLVQKIF